MFTKILIKKLAFIALASGLALGTQACAKKSFESINSNSVTGTGGANGSFGNNGGGGTGTNGGGTNGGGTNGGGTNGGGTNGGGTNGGGTNGGGTNGGGTNGGGTNGGGTNGGGTNGGGTNGGGTNGGGNNGGCDIFDPNCNYNPRYCVTEQFEQPDAEITRKLDVWIITDSSSSLDDERQALANGITNYLAQIPSNVDARFAVTLAHGPTSWFAGRLYKSDFKDPNEKYVISSKTNSPQQVKYWMQRKLLYRQKDYNVRAWNDAGHAISGQALRGLPTDYDADGGEAGLLSMYEALRPYSGLDRYDSLQNLHNELPGELNFLRPDAALAIIFVADENDICTPDSTYDPDNLEAPFRSKYCSGITALNVLKQLKQRRQSLPLYISSIIYTGKGAIPTGLENSIGHGYNTFTSIANGTQIDIASDSIPAGLSHIAALTSTRLDLRYDFELSYKNVDAPTIEVGVDGYLTSHTYDSPTNTVSLNYAGGARSDIEIYYCLKKGADLVPNQIGVSSYLKNKVPQTYTPHVTVEQK